MSIWEIVGIVMAAISLGALIWAIRAGKLTANSVSVIGALLDKLSDVVVEVAPGTFEVIVKYVQKAVHAVEQMTLEGKLPVDNNARKDAAIELVKQYANLECIPIEDADIPVIESLIKAEVLALPSTKEQLHM